MSTVWFVDSSSLIHAMKVGLGSWIPGQPVPSGATRFLDSLFSGTQRVVINDLILNEIIAGSEKDGGQLEAWVRDKIASGRIEVDPLTPQQMQDFTAMQGGGERSLIDITAEKPAYQVPIENRRIVADENVSQREYFKDKGYTEANRLSVPGVFDERHQVSGLDADFKDGADYVREARKTGLNDNQIFGKELNNKPSIGDNFRGIMHDESGAATIPNGKHWDDLTDFVKNNKLRLAGEAVGTAAILVDSYETRQKIAEALARGDLRAADEEMGGLIGRSFGGAFAGALAGAQLGSAFGPAGAVAGAILGGITGAIRTLPGPRALQARVLLPTRGASRDNEKAKCSNCSHFALMTAACQIEVNGVRHLAAWTGERHLARGKSSLNLCG